MPDVVAVEGHHAVEVSRPVNHHCGSLRGRRTARTSRAGGPAPSSVGGTDRRTEAVRARGHGRRRSGPSPRVPGRSGRTKAPGSAYLPLSERLAQRLDRHLELSEQAEVFLRVAAQGREVVADDDGVDATEQTVAGAEVTEGELASAGIPQDGAGQRKTERG